MSNLLNYLIWGLFIAADVLSGRRPRAPQPTAEYLVRWENLTLDTFTLTISEARRLRENFAVQAMTRLSAPMTVLGLNAALRSQELVFNLSPR